jgi:TPR repeat protein
MILSKGHPLPIFIATLTLVLNSAILIAAPEKGGKPTSQTNALDAREKALSAEDQFLLGKSYAEGKGVQQSWTTAAEWWTKSAEGGEKRAQYNLGLLYNEGKGVEYDPLKAFQWIEKSSLQGNSRATGLLGYFYYLGIGTPIDETKGEALLRKAIKAGDIHAMAMLGDRMLVPRVKGSNSVIDEEKLGNLEKKQIQEALSILAQAGNAGIPRACRVIAQQYALDGSDPANAGKASQWYFKGAWLGEPYCQAQTALEYMRVNDPVDAYPWVLLASEQKEPTCTELLNSVYKSLTPEQRKDGETKAGQLKDWIARLAR